MRNPDELVKQGYVQISRKRRLIRRLPVGKTGLQALQEVAPEMAAHLLAKTEEWATQIYMRTYGKPEDELALTDAEFLAFYKAVHGAETKL